MSSRISLLIGIDMPEIRGRWPPRPSRPRPRRHLLRLFPPSRLPQSGQCPAHRARALALVTHTHCALLIPDLAHFNQVPSAFPPADFPEQSGFCSCVLRYSSYAIHSRLVWIRPVIEDLVCKKVNLQIRRDHKQHSDVRVANFNHFELESELQQIKIRIGYNI